MKVFNMIALAAVAITITAQAHASSCAQFSKYYKADVPGVPGLQIIQHGCNSLEVVYVYPDSSTRPLIPIVPNEQSEYMGGGSLSGWFNTKGYKFSVSLRGNPGPNVGSSRNAFAGVYTVYIDIEPHGPSLDYYDSFYGTDDSGMKEIPIKGLGKHLTFTEVKSLASPQTSAAAQSADGTWVVQSRLCSDGQPAQDSFQLGSSQMTLAIKGTVGLLTVISGESNQAILKISPELHQISVVRDLWGDFDPKSPETYPYTIAGDTLMLKSSGFGPGGSCKPGQDLFTTFTRVEAQ